MITKLGAALIGAMLAGTAAHAAPVDYREANMQGRINQGVRDGSLNRFEGGRLEAREFRIEREVGRDRAFHGGHLTGCERSRIEHQENRLSRSIYRDRHDRF